MHQYRQRQRVSFQPAAHDRDLSRLSVGTNPVTSGYWVTGIRTAKSQALIAVNHVRGGIRRRLNRAMLAALLVATGTVTATAAFAAEVETGLSGPDVVIIASEERTVYEYRHNGALRYIRVVPKIGKPYLLVPADPTRGNGNLDQSEKLVPSWTIVEF